MTDFNENDNSEWNDRPHNGWIGTLVCLLILLGLGVWSIYIWLVEFGIIE